MLKEIAGSVVEWLNGVKRKIALQLLLLVGTLTAMQQRDVGLTRFLLQNYQEPGFSLALRFLKEQSKQSVLSLKDAEYFLSICPQQIGKDLGQTQYWQEIDIYLNIILHLSFNSDRQNISILYHKYFANRLHHFVHQGTASTFLKLANFFLSRKDQTNQEELLVCGLQALKICRRQECQEEVGSMSIDLLKNNYSIQFIFLEADSEISDQPVAL